MALPKKNPSAPYGAERNAMLEQNKSVSNNSPKEPTKELRSRRVTTMFTPTEYKKLRVAAANEEKTMSSLIQDIVTSYLSKL